MQLELTSPACLLLGMVNLDGQLCELGVALQYPPIQLAARSSDALAITGGRADLAHRQAGQFLAHHGLPARGEVEIEYAIPSFMGLGSAGLLALSMAASYAALNGLPTEETVSLARAAGLLGGAGAIEALAFTYGGLLAGAGDEMVLHADIPPGGDERDWVWVLVLPRVPADTPADLEDERRMELLAAGPHIGGETGRLAHELSAAAARDGIEMFAQSLERLQALNYAALEHSGAPHALAGDEHAILDIMKQHGALVCGRAIAGMALFGLVRGGGASRAMRQALAGHLGLFGGNVMASVAAHSGAQILSRL